MAPDAGGGDVAVLRLQGLGLLADILQHGLQVFEVEQQQLVVVGDLEDQREHSRLRVVEVEQAAEEKRTHLGNRGAYGMALLAEDVPEGNRGGIEGEVVELQLLHALGDLGIVLAGLADAGEVALDVGGEDRHADAAEGLSHDLQGDGLAGAGCARHQAVTIGHLRKQKLGVVAGSDEQGLSHRLPRRTRASDCASLNA